MTQQEIQPRYVAYNQAVWLKEKGFNLEVQCFYSKYGAFNYLNPHREYEHLHSYSEQIESYFTGKYNWNSLNVDEGMICLKTAFSECDEWCNCECSAPEQWQVVEWLIINHGIWISLVADNDYTFKFEINTWSWYENEKCYRLGHRVLGETMWETSSTPYKSPQEAYSAAFDYIISNNLI